MIKITYGILVKFKDSFISDFVTYDFDVNHIGELDLYDHAHVCAEQLNYYCNQKQEQGELIKFECENTDLTEEMKAILIKH